MSEPIEGFLLSPMQRRQWRVAPRERPLAVRATIEIEGRLDPLRVERAMAELAGRHDALRLDLVRQPGLVVPLQAPGKASRLDWALEPIGPDRHALELSAPVACADRRSLAVAAAELAAVLSGRALEEPVSYLAFAEWANESAGAASPAGAATRLPFERATDPERFEPRALPPVPVPDGWRAFAREAGVPLDAVVLGLWAILLARHAGTDDAQLGEVVEGRPFEELQGAIGLFAHWRPLRLDAGGRRPVAAFVRDVERARREARERAEVEVAPDEARAPVLFESRSLPPPIEAGGLRWVFRRLEADLEPARLTLVLSEPDGLELRHDASAVDLEYAGSLGRQLVSLGDGLRPGASIADLDPMPGRDRERLVVLFNRTGPGRAAGRLAHELFEDHAARAPEAIAVEGAAGRRWTYAELDARANRLARALAARGIGPGSVVAVALERSPSLVATVLGVMKAGAAWLPIDRAHPLERRAFQASDAGCRLLVRGPDGEPLLGIDSLELDDDSPLLAEGDARAPAIRLDPDALAYVLYTSGSTGRPKGVMVPHRGLAAYLAWSADAYRLAGGDGSLVDTPLSFDLTITSLLSPLAAGQRVVLLPEDDGVASLAAALSSDRDWSAVKITPAHLRALAALFGGREVPGRIRTLVVGGEALHAGSLAPWTRVGRVINEYGPTETVVGCSIEEVDPRAGGDGPVPIGRPIEGARLYVLDGRGRPVPPGIAGELHVGGAGLAHGYLARPALTAERFVPDPFAPCPGGRLYRTGDRCRFRPDGRLEYLGRTDGQVKVRGYRVELGEIEAALAAEPGVQGAAALLREDPPGGARLVAYAAGRGLDGDALRARLAARLPEPMVPAAVVVLPALPLTRNGKVDRAALPAPECVRRREHVPPSTAAERALARIWSEVLRVETIGLEDDFFALGGDSILAIQVVGRAREAGLAIRPDHLRRHSDLRSLAAAATPVQERGPALPPTGDVPLTPIQRWFFDRRPEVPSHFNQAVLLEAAEPFDAIRLEGAAARLVERHDALRLRFEPEAPGSWRARVVEPSGGESLVWTGPDLWQRVQRSLDLARGPLLRLGVDGRRLLVAIHHLAVDGVSWPILLEDLERAYADRPLAPPTASWREWAIRRAASATPSVPAGEPAPPLPVDAAEGPDDEGSARTVESALDAETTRRVVARSAPGDLLAAALVRAIESWRGPGPVDLEVEGHGRGALGSEIDVSRTVGWFTAMRALRIDRAGGSALAALGRARPGGRPEIRFNYLGRLDALPGAWQVVAEPAGEARDPGLARDRMLEVDAATREGRLRLAWRYSIHRHRRETIEALARRFEEALREVLDEPLGRLSADPAVEAVRPLPGAARGILLDTLRDPGAGLHVEQMVVDLEPETDREALAAAWSRLLDEEPSLRTTAAWRGLDEPVLVVHRRAALPVERTGEDLEAYLARDAARGFDLERPPLLRLALLDRHAVWTHHHLLLDGWSRAIVLGRLLELHRDPSAPRPERPDLPVAIEEPAPVEPGRPTPVGRPSVSPAPALRGPERFGDVEGRLPGATWAALEERARRARRTGSDVLRGAWALLLARYSGLREVAFGATVSGRDGGAPGIERQVGLLIRTVGVRFEVRPGERFWDWLVRESEREAAVGPGWADESLLVVENYPVEAAPGLAVRYRGARTRSSLVLLAVPGDGLAIHLVHDRTRIADVDAARIRDHLLLVLEALAAGEPDTGIASTRIGEDAVPRRLAPARSTGTGSPTDALELELAGLAAESLRVPHVGAEDDVFDLGASSVSALELAARIEARFGRRLPLSALLEARTVSALAAVLRREGSPAAGPLVAIRSTGSKAPFFCVHPAGGNVLAYAGLARALDPERPFHAFQARTEPPVESVEAMARDYLELARRVRPGAPLLVGGWSFGGLVAFEMARQAAAKGEPAAGVVILDTPAPILPLAEAAPPDEAGWILEFVRIAAALARREPPLAPADLEGLSGEELYRTALRRLESAGLAPPGAAIGPLRATVEVFRANARARDAYARHRPADLAYRGRVVVLRADHGLPDLGWSSIPGLEVEVHEVPGDHVSMLDPTNVAALGAILGRVLDRLG